MTYQCIGEYAVKPYYIEGICLNVFSLEELLYYLKGNACLLDRSIMNENLIRFIGEELKLEKLAKELTGLMNRNADTADFVCAILNYAHYGSEEELQELRKIIAGNSDQRDEIRKKTRGDFYFANGRYTAAGEEYMQALEETPEEDIPLRAALYHALGVTYVKAFLFSNAAKCFHEEIVLMGKGPAVRDYLLCLRMSADRQTYESEVLKLDPDPETVRETEELIKKAEETAESRMKELYRVRQNDRQEYRRQTDVILSGFKNGYRRK